MAKVDINVADLIGKVNRSELQLPEMQRRYVWTAPKVRDLLDSLYRNYPSGTILVWETDDGVDSRSLSVETDNLPPTTSQKLLLLDGQQRLTSLQAVLAGKPIEVRRRKRPIDILFNLEHPEGPPSTIYEVDEPDMDFEELEDGNADVRDIQSELNNRVFVVSTPSLKNNPLWVSVADVFTLKDREILRPIGIDSNDDRWDKYTDRLNDVRKIKDYQYVMQVLGKEMPYEEVAEIFVRVNSLGAKLRSSDLALAQITSKWRGFMKILENFCKEFGDDAEYISEWIAVRALTVFATKQALYKNVNRVKKEDLEVAWEKAKAGIHDAYNFVKNNAGLEYLNQMSASMLIIPIAVYYMNNDGNITPEEEKKLLKWFFNAHMHGHYGMGSTESILNKDLAELFRTGSLDNLLKILFEHVKQFEVKPDSLAFRGRNSPYFTMIFNVLRQQGAKDWHSGVKISAKSTGSKHSIQHHHIFPKSLLSKAGVDSKLINEISNFAFIGGKTNRSITNKEPSIYLQEIIKKNGSEAIEAQHVPVNSELQQLANYEDFLEFRRRELATMINEFMAKFED